MKKLVIALTIAATAITASAGQHRTPRAARGEHRRAFAALGLSDAQKQQIRDIQRADRESNQQLYADFRTKLRQFRQLKRAGDPAADGLKAELQPMREQMQALRKARHQAVMGVLTPEQRQQLEQRRAEHPRRRG